MYKNPFLDKNKDKYFCLREVLILMKRFNHRLLMFVSIVSLIEIMLFWGFSKNNEVEALSKYGSRGDEVKQIQQKLKNWGYYNGAVDGIYGSKTLEAVKYFQRKNGLTVDGIAGPATLKAMGIFNSSTSSGSSNSSDLNLLARLVYGEARGEPYTGQVAVAAVVLNRVKSSKFPNSIAGVIYQPGAFDVVSDGQINMSPNSTAIKAAQDALNGWDPSYGSIYYFNPNTATSSWIWSRPHVVTIGNHRFCK
mgnify:CR=1 FL=1